MCQTVIKEVQGSTYGDKMQTRIHTYHTSCGSDRVVPFSPQSCKKTKKKKLGYFTGQNNIKLLHV